MNTFFDRSMGQGNYGDRDVLSAFRKTQEQRSEIQQGMSPKEIAEIFSDRLMEVVKDQFQEARKKFEEKKD
ncbi:MAG: hypothetical protein BGO55_12515 [Sphingobacteriales bacterium 50-39]|nr:hypothetical protein [Sphingobacteriales bacterium]OJW57135.1 MAG: hypothetical protein BGO55_12515 [Sphingobacteriales bacterium 50-39]